MFEKKANEMIEKAEFIRALGAIYDSLYEKMKWDCMRYNDSDETHDKPYFTEYQEDEMMEYQKASYRAYKAVLESIEKMAK